MSAFSQLGHGFKSNVVTVKSKKVDPGIKILWNHLSTEDKLNMILKEYPEFWKRSDLFRYAIISMIEKDPSDILQKHMPELLNEE